MSSATRPHVLPAATDRVVTVKPVRHTADAVLRDLLSRQPDTPAKVTFAWRIAAGPALARAGTTSWTDGVLRVEAPSVAWQREIARARPVIAERLNHVLGPGVVTSIEVRVTDHARPRRRPQV
jgi:predicted nucleic acid-binding Zn ribbon protein